MNKFVLLTSFSLFFFFNNSTLFGQNLPTVNSTIREVTVFPSGAQVTRIAETTLASGKSELVFSGISPSIDKESIQVKGEGNFTILSVVHQTNFLREQETRLEIASLETQRTEVIQKQELDKRMLAVFKNEEAMLARNQLIQGGEQGVKAMELREAVDFHSSRLTEALIKQLELERQINKADSAVLRLSKQLQSLNQPRTDRATSELLVTVQSESRAAASFAVSYFVRNAGWFATYDLRVADIKSPIDLAFKANVFQNSGEDWNEIKLLVSNGNPTESGTAPVIYPWYLRFGYPETGMSTTLQGRVAGVAIRNGSAGSVSGKVVEQGSGLPLPGATVLIAGTSIGTVTDLQGNFTLSVPQSATQMEISFIGYRMREVPISEGPITIALEEDNSSLQEVVVTGYGGKGPLPRREQAAAPVATTNYQPTSFSFELDRPYTVLNDGKVYTVDLATHHVPTTYEYYAVPKIEKAAYLTAKISDWQDLNLLDGEVNLFFEGTYLGKSILELEKAGDTLKISLGKDRGIVVERKRLTDFRSKTFFGNSTTESRTYEFAIRNNKSTPINMLLQDQFPISTNDDIEVDETSNGGAEVEKETKILSWKLEIPERTEIKRQFGFQIKYPRGQMVAID